MRNAECGMRNISARFEPGYHASKPAHQFRIPNSAFRIPHSSGGAMKSHTHYLWFTTKQRQEIIDVTDQVAEQVRESGVAEGFALVSAMHITASVVVHENGSSDVHRAHQREPFGD